MKDYCYEYSVCLGIIEKRSRDRATKKAHQTVIRSREAGATQDEKYIMQALSGSFAFFFRALFAFFDGLTSIVVRRVGIGGI
jgi:hypothetical protein